MDDLIDRFRQHFGAGDTCCPEAMAEFWERLQGPEESTVKYVEENAWLARRLWMRGNEFTLHDAIQGMLDDVRHDVVMLQPTTLDALRKVANIADARTR